MLDRRRSYRPLGPLYDSAVLSDADLWHRLRLAFKCVCAATPRLRITAEHFRQHLWESVEIQAGLRDRLASALDWIVGTDIAEWLVPSPDTPEYRWQTFRDSHLILSSIETAHIPFPRPVCPIDDLIWVFVGPASWCASRSDALAITIEECLADLQEGRALTVFEGPFDSVAFVLCLQGWGGYLCPPSPHIPSKVYHSCLAKETLLGDFVRLALRLWGLGIPACVLFTPDLASPFAPLLECQALEKGTEEGFSFLRSVWAEW